MLIATTIFLVGLLAGIVAAQLYGLRLGGVIVAPLVAVYLLWNFATFPVFVLSTLTAYVSVHALKSRLPLYGRQVFLFAILAGALVPLTMLELLSLGFGVERTLSEVEFVGSVLPGIAAYNYHRLEPDRRVLDGVVSLAVLLALVVLGIALTIAVGLTPLSSVLPPLLLSPESDIAAALGLTVARQPLPIIASNRLSLSVVTVGLATAELVRARYGLRLAGVIVVPLVVLMSFRNAAMLPLWVLSAGFAYVGVWVMHRWTLVYGRVLLAFAIIISLLTTISVVSMIPVRHGLLPFFIALLSGITAYNVHVVPPAERLATVAVTVGALVGIAVAARLFIVPPPRGLLRSVTVWDLRVAAAVLVPAVVALLRFERLRPSRSALPANERLAALLPGGRN